jgi:6-phospho-beta-glucosidase
LECNNRLFFELQNSVEKNIQGIYMRYLEERHGSYEENYGNPSPLSGFNLKKMQELAPDGYAGVALDFIEGITGIKPGKLILNVPNGHAIEGMGINDVVEIMCGVDKDKIRTMPVGKIPDHCLGLMKQVKAYEKLTIEAVQEESYRKAWLALTLHPLVQDEEKAKYILDEYIAAHQVYFPKLS